MIDWRYDSKSKNNQIAIIILVSLFLLVLLIISTKTSPAQSSFSHDKDQDGLIEIENPEQLASIIHDKNGSGNPDSDSYFIAFPNNPRTECPNNTCKGYELIQNINLEGKDWVSIEEYNAVFEGNGYIISNLRSNTNGLFKVITANAIVQNLSLKDINIHNENQGNIGGITGINNGGTIQNVQVSGTIFSSRSDIGGIAGVNKNNGIINTSSTNMDDLQGSISVGGVVGRNQSGQINSCYSKSYITGTKHYIGGIVGLNEGSIGACYTYETSIQAGKWFGELIGSNIEHNGNTVGSVSTISYWTTQDGTKQTRGIGAGDTDNAEGITSELIRKPTNYTGIYKTWRTNDVWDFGTDKDYPSLKRITTEKLDDTIKIDESDRIDGSEIHNEEETNTTFSKDYDKDNDGLIEISNIEELDAIRHDTNGDGTPDSEKEIYYQVFNKIEEGTGCPGKCNGYELIQDLDFRNPVSYNSRNVNPKWIDDEGWYPIENYDSILEGNGYVIFNLYSKNNGLFENILENAGVVHIGIQNINVESVKSNVGGLVGFTNGGYIESSYVIGNIWGEKHVGGVSGDITKGAISKSYFTGEVYGDEQVGCLVGTIKASIIHTSYVNCKVKGDKDVGGITGRSNYSSTVSGTYSIGEVNGDEYTGGLIGDNDGIVATSYTISKVIGDQNFDDNDAGGLIGDNDGTVSISSIWNTDTGWQKSGIGRGNLDNIKKADSIQMKTPENYTNIYKFWHIDIDNKDKDNFIYTGIDKIWDFGTTDEYPILKADIDKDGVATWQEFGDQR